MKRHLSTFFATSLFIAIFALAAHAQDGPIAGGYGDTDVKDKGVVEAARFAVRKQGQVTKSRVALKTINNAKIQVVAGLNYELCIETRITKGRRRAYTEFARVVVYRNLKNQYSLTSWTVLKDKTGC